MGKFLLNSFKDDDELAGAVARAWLEEIFTTQRAGKPHHVALSGGRIAKKFFLAAVESYKAKAISFNSVHFFWADERCVPPDDPESNFAAARQFLLEPLGVSSNQIHRVTGEDQPELAASKAEVELRRIVPSDANGQPLLDLILLGMGEDGHVASLFPTEDKALVSDKAIYRAVRNSPKPPPNRVTLGYSAIAAADRVWVLAAGAGKHEALRESLRPEGRTPLSHVLRLRRQTHIFSDISLK